MQSVSNNTFKFRLSPMMLACQLLCLGMSGAAYAEDQAQGTTELAKDEATKTVTITGRKAGMGLMVREDAPKSRSTVNREELQKQRPTGNPYQAMDLMPSVNAYNYDASGLFGGGLTMRGFNSDQIGVTINGVPVNDSGSYAVYPMEYVDQENVCSEFVTQGSTDIDSPQVGATGGNLGIVTCDPEEKARFRFAQTLGTLNLTKTYGRVDSGRFANDRAKVYLSYSHAESEKWRGEGKARRDHIDFGFRLDFDRFNYITGAILYNRALNNSFQSLTLSQINQNGYYYDYDNTFVGHLTGGPGSQVEKQTNSYYNLQLNPFEDVIASATAKFRIGEDTDIKITPYYWYGYGGGVSEQAQKEGGFLNNVTGKFNAGVDLNHDGDTLDSVLVASGSFTRTDRPGVVASVTKSVGDHTLFGGLWYEAATHRQTNPEQPVSANGSIADPWFTNNGSFLMRPDGTPYEFRNQRTESRSYQFSLQDTWSLMQDHLQVNFGVRRPSIRRDFWNYPNEYNTNNPISAIPYEIIKTYTETLPQIGVRYTLNETSMLFSSLSKNFRSPPNFIFQTSTNNVQLVNGQVTQIVDVQPETSWNFDFGYRYQSPAIIASATVFAVNFKNRQVSSYDPITQKNAFVNAGGVKNSGFDLEIGNTPINGWSLYASASSTFSKINDDLVVSSTTTLPTSGKEFPGTPKFKFGLSAQYETANWYVRLKAKHTSSQWSTLVNDEEAPAYNLFDLDGGYLFRTSEGSMFKNPKISFNISNLFSAQYRNPSAQTFLNAQPYGAFGASRVTYYLGAPRAASATFQVDF